MANSLLRLITVAGSVLLFSCSGVDQEMETSIRDLIAIVNTQLKNGETFACPMLALTIDFANEQVRLGGKKMEISPGLLIELNSTAARCGIAPYKGS